MIPWRKLQAGLSGKGTIKDVAPVVQHIANTTIDTISSLPNIINLDKVEDGANYQKLLATQISAGQIYLSDTAVYLAGYNPSQKRRVFTATPTTPYDIGDLWLDASVIKRCTTARATGAYVATDWISQTLDSVGEGATYNRVLASDISAGHILLSSNTESSGVWYNKTGVYIGAEYGIGLYGGQIALRTFPTYDDLVAGTNLQCYVGTDGKIYAGGGNISLDSTGLHTKGSVIDLQNAAGATRGAIYGQDNGVVIEVDLNRRLTLYRLDVTATDVTASRAKNTTYTNSEAGIKPLLVLVSLWLPQNGVATFLIHATADPPTTTTSVITNDNILGMAACLVGIVPLGWKYKVNSAAGDVQFWHEVGIG